MGGNWKAALVALNAYLHDFSVALAFTSSLVAYWLTRELHHLQGYYSILLKLRRLIIFSFAGIFVFGAVRVYFYRTYEMPAGVDESVLISVLVAKHIILASLLIGALYLSVKFWKLAGRS